MSPTLERDDPMAAMLGALRSPTRNRYFYGKMLDAHHLKLEQDYVNQMRWLMNRLSLGTGVLCGLQVKVLDSAKNLIQVGSGVAVDGLGREIIVPTPTNPLDFMKLVETDRTPHMSMLHPTAETLRALRLDPADYAWVAGHSETAPTAAARTEARIYTAFVCYHECCVEPVPVMVTDECEPERRCEHGLIRERYVVTVKAGIHMPPDNGFPELCQELFDDITRRRLGTGEARRAVPELETSSRAAARWSREKLLRREERLALMCEKLRGNCDPRDPICVPIAVLYRTRDAWQVKPCPPPRLLLSNEILLEMILCLADCCGGKEAPPPPTEKKIPFIVDLQPKPAKYTTMDEDRSVMDQWGFKNTWTFSLTFSQKMNDLDVNGDPGAWLRAYLVFPTSVASPTLAVAPPANVGVVVRMGLKCIDVQKPVGTSGEYVARYQITIPTKDESNDAIEPARKLLATLRGENPDHPDKAIAETLLGFRFLILMRATAGHPTDATGTLLNADNDGVGPTFDTPRTGGPREQIFNDVNLSTPGSAIIRLVVSEVLDQVPSNVETTPTPAITTNDSWFSAAFDFVNQRIG